ncbi:MAG: PEPxxWA-CTERM sorting domain-containing protein [Sphingomonadales bacterium]
MKTALLTTLVAVAAMAAPAQAATNIIKNGSFEQAGTTGTGAFSQWTKTNVPSGFGADQAASVIGYNNNASYPDGAYGEAVSPDNTASHSPDAVGSHGAYFVGDFSVNETISQLSYLGPGNYRVGFSYYLTANGLANVGNASFDATILNVAVASTAINSSSPGQVWQYATGVAQIVSAGWYDTSFVYNSNLNPSKDIVIDRVFAVRTTDAANVIIPTSTITVPEPASWAMLIMGFGLVGLSSRRRKAMVAA